MHVLRLMKTAHEGLRCVFKILFSFFFLSRVKHLSDVFHSAESNCVFCFSAACTETFHATCTVGKKTPKHCQLCCLLFVCLWCVQREFCEALLAFLKIQATFGNTALDGSLIVDLLVGKFSNYLSSTDVA